MRNHLKRMPCGFCGMEIVVYDGDNPKSTPRRYCDGHCRNEAKKQRHREKTAGGAPKIVPYKCESRKNPRKAYIRERDLANGSHIRIARFVEPGSTGDRGINLTYLSPVKDGQRTELKFALSDEAAAATQWMLAEFFGVGMYA